VTADHRPLTAASLERGGRRSAVGGRLGNDMAKIIETTFRVRYAETDASGVVYHANYLVWFEHGRGEWFWQQGGD